LADAWTHTGRVRMRDNKMKGNIILRIILQYLRS